MKIFNEAEDFIFQNFNLTSLMVLEEWPKKANKVATNVVVSQLFKLFLADYGFRLGGYTLLRDLNNVDTKIKVAYITIPDIENFPVENIEMIPQLYGYQNILVDITLRVSEEYAHSFDYNSFSGECILKKNVYGSSEVLEVYPSLRDLMNGYKLKYGK